MKTVVRQFDRWHKTRVGHFVMAVIELAAAYVLGSRAIDTASWWQYLFTLVFLIGGLQNLVRVFTRKTDGTD